MNYTFAIGNEIKLKPIDSHTPTQTNKVVSIEDQPYPGAFDGATRQILTLDNGKKVVGHHCLPANV